MKIHFIGIGGIGVSALAQYYLSQKAEVFGSDLYSSEITEMLEKKGVRLFLGEQKADNISPDLDLVVYSPAVNRENLELKKANELGIKAISYPKALAEISKDYFTIAVSGAHGKSTTAAMISLVLMKNGFSPTAILGTKLKEFGNSNFLKGNSKYLVIEADEYKGSFLNYYPNIIVLTNIEEEHLDYYGKIENILEAFKEYISHLPSDGVLVFNKDDQNIKKLDLQGFKKIGFSKADKEIQELKNILQIPGLHNALNALAAFKTVRELGLVKQDIFSSLQEFKGAWRRFEILNNERFVLVSDYAHHPTEIKATLQAAREKWPKKTIWAIFQPHQKQRTHYLFEQLVACFVESTVDKIIFVPIYDVAGREKKSIKVSSEMLCQAIKDKGKEALFVPDLQEAKEFLQNNVSQDDLVLIMGAGNVYDLTKMLST